MNAAQLLQHFDRISDAPDAIQRLRRFILDLAVRGKLVEQDPSDEPASELKLLNSGSLETRSGLPPHWIKVKVGKALDFQYGKALPANERFGQGRVCVFGSNGVVAYCAESLTEEPAIIIGRKGSAGALNLCVGPSWTTDVAYFVQPPEFFDVHFLFIALQTLDLDNLGKGVKPGLSRSDAYELEIVVPPIPEQYRIVAKVDELMALCDKLEAAQTERRSWRDQLAAASLLRMNQPDNEPKFREHARFHLRHISRLTTRPEHIQQLRQTIHNLAVRGRLVPQDLKDKPAAELLKHIGAKKSIDGPFSIPPSWAWTQVDQIAESRLGKMLDRAKNKGTPRRYLRNVNVRWFDFNLSDVLEMRFEDTELEEFALRGGDVLICEGGEPGRAAVWDERERCIYFQKAIHRIRFCEGVNPHFFVNAIRESANSGRLSTYFTGVGIKHLTGKGLASFTFPLPPLAEQHRIVAKVDEVMALCDRLEAQLTAAQNESRLLLEALLHEALAPVA